jgi:hypothetical protein
MDHKVFREEMGRIAIAVGSELSPVMLECYWESFSGWTDDQFQAAAYRCRQELDKMPSIHQIRERWSSCRESNTVALIQSSQPRLTHEVDQSSLDKAVDKLTNEEIQELMKAHGYSESSTNVVIKKYGVGIRDSGFYHKFLKDLITPGWEESPEHWFCNECQDRGVIEVYSPRKNSKEASIGTWFPTMVACHCSQGDKQTQSKETKKFNAFGPMLRFNANNMLRVGSGTPAEENAKIQEFAAHDRRPANYNSEFDDWK